VDARRARRGAQIAVRVELDVGGRLRTVTIETRGAQLAITLDGRPVDVDVARLGLGRYSLRVPGTGRQHDVTVPAPGHDGQIDVVIGGATVPVTRRTGHARSRHVAGGASGDGPQRLLAPMPGKVVRVLVKPGDQVVARQGVVVVEAMKMENELRAGRSGLVREVLVVEGASVDAGAPLVVIG
jgi:glutaconyl-CoA/methylmalonyl-CoA decarboxylase subunit gamma